MRPGQQVTLNARRTSTSATSSLQAVATRRFRGREKEKRDSRRSWRVGQVQSIASTSTSTSCSEGEGEGVWNGNGRWRERGRKRGRGRAGLAKVSAAAAEGEGKEEEEEEGSFFEFTPMKSLDESVENGELLGAKQLILPKTNSGKHIGSWLFRLLLIGSSKNAWRLYPAFLLTFAGKFAGIYGAVLFKKAVDAVMMEGSTATGLKIALTFLAGSGMLKALKSVSSEARHVIFAPLSQQLSRFLALKIFSHLFSLDSTFHVNRETGGVINIVERGIRAILTFFRTSVLTLIPTMVEWGLVCGFVATKFSLGIAGVLVATFVAYSAWTIHWTQISASIRKQAINRDIEVSSKLADSLLNYETVVLSGNEDAELRSYNKLLRQFQHFSIQNVYGSAALNSGQGVVIAMGMTCSLVLTVMGCFNGSMSVGDIVLVQSLLLQLLEPLQFLGWYYSSLKNCFVDLEALLKILMTKSKLKDGDTPLEKFEDQKQPGVSVALRDARYSYQNDRQILKGINMSIRPGESVALVGSSGSGKSTLLRMILRLYDVDSGSVSIDSHPIKNLKLESLRESVALIPQDTLMFNDTIHNNVKYCKLAATKEEVLEAIKGAQLDKLISSLPLGYDTVVGERGIKLSGGERQRIAIARAILRQPRLLVCDEATSSLDSETEAEIMSTLRSVARGRTCVFISHRLSTVQHCDHIHVLSEGRIVESGTHQKLLSRTNGAYSKMWEVQEKVESSEEELIYNSN